MKNPRARIHRQRQWCCQMHRSFVGRLPLRGRLRCLRMTGVRGGSLCALRSGIVILSGAGSPRAGFLRSRRTPAVQVNGSGRRCLRFVNDGTEVGRGASTPFVRSRATVRTPLSMTALRDVALLQNRLRGGGCCFCQADSFQRTVDDRLQFARIFDFAALG
jgi:hypothetical protein